ncbi:MAG: SUMF1/EgtB/PvdO family nonheme iron enzyme [Planctomycetes bacterium]|nr:SUMF1/EgtB/PvdO family nonheme iron enzyme [Planctomycetota bacterium]
MKRYEVVEELGRGGMGAVYLAMDRVLGRKVALKTILGAAEGEILARFIEEARAAASLDHPAIVPTYEIGTDGKDLYFTMEPVEGRTLSAAIRAGDLPLRDAVRALAEVARGVAYAHEKGLVHRDLKPQNVMLTPRGDVRILDWGLVRARKAERGTRNGEAGPGGAGGGEAVHGHGHGHGPRSRNTVTGGTGGEKPPGALRGATLPLSATRLTRTGAVMGTLAYMSPEQAGGETGRIGPATDVYALGAILYEILAGVPPHQGTYAQILARLVDGKLEPPSSRAPGREVPRELEAIALQAMARDPAQRYESAAHLARDLEAWLAGRPVSVLPPPWPVRAARWVGDHRLLASGAALALAAAVAVAVAYSYARSYEEGRRRNAELREKELLGEGHEEAAREARSSLDRAREASRAWREAHDAWRAQVAREDRVLSSLPLLPAMDDGESLDAFEKRTKEACAAFFDGEAGKEFEEAIRSRQDPTGRSGGSPELRVAAGSARRALVAAVAAARQAQERLESAAELAGRDAPERGVVQELARVRLEAALEEALALEADSLSPRVIATAPRTAAWETDSERVPRGFQELLSILAEDRKLLSPGLAWDRAMALLGAKRPVRVAPLPPGATAELFLLTGEPLWTGGDARAGMARVLQVDPAGFEGDLDIGEYLLVLATDGREVRHPFLVRRDREGESLDPAFPSAFPPGTVYVPAGEFLAGGSAPQALPRHLSRVEDPFFLQESEVTLAEWREFLGGIWASGHQGLHAAMIPQNRFTDRIEPVLERTAEGGYLLLDRTADWNHPVFGVSYVMAAVYARWKSASDPGRRLWRLPTAQEWELAAAGPSGRGYPWGERFDRERVRCYSTRGDGYTVPATSHVAGRGLLGAYQMSGNAMEWVATPFTRDFVTLRGGAWGSTDDGARVAARVGFLPSDVVAGSGFRLVCVPAEVR